MNQLTNFLIEDGLVSRDMLVILLGLPFIVTIIGVSRYYIGVKTYSLYSSILLSVAYLLIAINYQDNNISKVIAGIIIGLSFTIIMTFSSIFTHFILRRIRMHYFPKISLIICINIIIIISSLILINYFGILKAKNIDITGLILIAVNSELFINRYIKKKFKVSIKLTIETLLISLVCYLFVALKPIQNLLLNHPEIILITPIFNYFIGRFTGLRLSEYFRFQDILNKNNTPDEPI
jgi:hypothetical protein